MLPMLEFDKLFQALPCKIRYGKRHSRAFIWQLSDSLYVSKAESLGLFSETDLFCFVLSSKILCESR